MTDSNYIDTNEIVDALGELERMFDELSKAGETLQKSLAKVSDDFHGLSRESGGDGDASFGSLERFGKQLVDSVHGTGRALYNGDFGDMGMRVIRNLAGRLGDDVSSFVSDALGGGFFADLLGGILGEFVRGIEGLFGGTKKMRLPDVKLDELFNPPAMMSAPEFALPSSAFYSGRYPNSNTDSNAHDDESKTIANVNVTVNGVVGAPRDVADEIGRIITRTLADLNRRGA